MNKSRLLWDVDVGKVAVNVSESEQPSARTISGPALGAWTAPYKCSGDAKIYVRLVKPCKTRACLATEYEVLLCLIRKCVGFVLVK